VSAPSLLFPPRFAVGDTIGLAAPASPPDKPNVIEESIARFESLGFKIKTGANLYQRDGYLAGSDEQRASDINALFADPEVKAVFALRGGYGSCRILPLLDYDIIRDNPKPFVGYSDITAMHLAILVKTGLITFHGSNASSAFTDGNIDVCRRILIAGDGAAPGNPGLLFSREGVRGADIKTVVSGEAGGQLIGGNMTCLSRLLATPYSPYFRGAILFLEDTGEKAYRVDGMFTHLRLVGILDQISGLIIGQFDHPDPAEQERIAAVLEREAKRINVPCVTGAPIGHFPEQIIVPQGAHAVLDADKGTLRVMSGAGGR
jgi:muramoyltetrapeptide carboxypeptidase